MNISINNSHVNHDRQNFAKPSALFKPGDTFSAKIVNGEPNSFLMQTANGYVFELNSKDLNGTVGESFNFRVLGSSKNGMSIELIKTQTEAGKLAALKEESDIMIKLMKEQGFAEDINILDRADNEKKAAEEQRQRDAAAKLSKDLSELPENEAAKIIKELVSSGLSPEKITAEMLLAAAGKTEKQPKPAKPSDMQTALSMLNDIDELDDPAIVRTLKYSVELTLGSIYKAKFSGGKNTGGEISDSKLEDLAPHIERLLEENGVPPDDNNIEAAKFLVKHSVELNGENISRYCFLKRLSENISPGRLLSLANENKTGRSIIEVPLFQASKDVERIKSEYERLIQDVRLIKPEKIDLLVKNSVAVTLGALISDRHKTHTGEEQNSAEQKRIFAEIALKLTSEAGTRLAEKNIRIETLPLKKALEEINRIEYSKYAAALKAFDAQPNDESLRKTGKAVAGIHELKKLSSLDFVALFKSNRPISVNNALRYCNKADIAAVYEESSTPILQKYGDSFSKIKHRFGGLLERLCIEPGENNIKAAQALSASKTDVTAESVMKASIMISKLQRITQSLTPAIVSSMVKEGLNPLEMHIDEMQAYTDAFEEAYGKTTAETVEERLYKAMKNPGLSQTEKDGMKAVFKSLSYVLKNNCAAIGAVIASGASLKLSNFMSALENVRRSGSVHFDITDDYEGIEYKSGIRMKIEKMYAELSGKTSNSELDIAETLKENKLGKTVFNLQKILTADENNFPVLKLEHRLAMLRDFAENIEGEDILSYLRKNDDADFSCNLKTEAPEKNIKPQDASIYKAISEQALLWAGKNRIPKNPKNLRTIQALLANEFYKAKAVNALPNNQKSKIADLLREEGVFADVGVQLREMLEDSQGSTAAEEALTSVNLLKAAGELSSGLYEQDGRLSGLNMYIVNNSFSSKDSTTYFISLDTGGAKTELTLAFAVNSLNVEFFGEMPRENTLAEIKSLARSNGIENINFTIAAKKPEDNKRFI